jgi:hypothetical protein
LKTFPVSEENIRMNLLSYVRRTEDGYYELFINEDVGQYVGGEADSDRGCIPRWGGKGPEREGAIREAIPGM